MSYHGYPDLDAVSRQRATESRLPNYVTSYETERMAIIASFRPALQRAYHAVDNAINAGARQVTPIVVLAYPRIVPYIAEDRGYCSRILSHAELQFGARITEQLNRTIADEVDKARKDGVPIIFAADTEDAMMPNHTICDQDPHAVRNTLWRVAASILDGLPLVEILDGAEQLHPNAQGYQDVTAALVRWSNRPEVPDRLSRGRPHYDPPLKVGRSVSVSLRETVDAKTAGVLQPAGSVTIQGSRYAPNSPVEITIHSAPQVLGTRTADDTGHITAAVAVPPDLSPGRHLLRIAGFDAQGMPMATFAVIELRRPVSWPTAALGTAAPVLVILPLLWWRREHRRDRSRMR
jgi:hypothetical protein